MAGINTNAGYQMPTTNKVANTIFDAPTIVRVKSFMPYALNSFTILLNRNIQTKATDKATISWAITE